MRDEELGWELELLMSLRREQGHSQDGARAFHLLSAETAGWAEVQWVDTENSVE